MKIRTPQGQGSGVVRDAAFSPDSEAVAAAGDDALLRVWDLHDPQHPQLASQTTGPKGTIQGLAWNPRLNQLAAVSDDGHAYLYDVSDLARPRQLSEVGGFDSELMAVVFSPDGSLMAAAGNDAVIRLWDVSDPVDPTPVGEPITGPTTRLFKLAFNGDGHELVAASTDGTVWRWDVSRPASPSEISVLGPVPGPLYGLATDPQAPLVAAAGGGAEGLGELHVWRTDVDAVIDQLCRGVGAPITRDEWSSYLPSVRFDPPCTRKR